MHCRVATARLALLAALVTSGCAAITGLSEYDVAGDLEGDAQASDGGAAESASADVATKDVVVSDVDPQLDAPPPCDPNKDNACIELPAGFQLVVVTPETTAPSVAACPSGFGKSQDLGSSPAGKGDSCTCSCSVSVQGKCSGPLTSSFGNDINCSNLAAPNVFKNVDNCNQDVPNVLNDFQKFSISASGGACTQTTAVPHPDRVAWGNNARLCESTSRCGSGICDGTNVPAPFQVCVASGESATEAACPPAFPTKRVLGVTAQFSCGACSACSVSYTTCTGNVVFSRNQGCSANLTPAVLDGTCHPFNPGTNDFKGYTVTATTTTTCSAGTASATSAAIATARTICCR